MLRESEMKINIFKLLRNFKAPYKILHEFGVKFIWEFQKKYTENYMRYVDSHCRVEKVWHNECFYLFMKLRNDTRYMPRYTFCFNPF